MGLGARLATAGGRPAWIRLGLMALGFAVGSGLLLSAMSIVPALGARDERESARYGDQVNPKRADDALLLWAVNHRYGDLTFDLWAVDAIGDAPVPLGLERVPLPGEIVVTPALAERWHGATAAALERRLHGRVVGTIGPEGVVGPDELAAWMGMPPEVVLPRREAGAIASFEAPGTISAPLDLGALITLVGIASAVLLPIWLFVATATRLSAATRETRLAAVRLAGGTEAQVRLLAGVEAGVAATIGTLAGIPVFLALRPVLAGGLILDLDFYPTDFAPPLAFAVTMLLALPALAVVMSLATMRRLIVSPLGIVRRTRRSHAGRRWVVVLAVGLAILAYTASRHEELAGRNAAETGLLIGAGLALTAFGLTGTATWTAWILARRFAGRARSVSALLGMRRIEADPGSVGRVVGGVALMIALAGVVQSGLIAVEGEDNASFAPGWVRALDPDAVLAYANQISGSEALSALADVDGVRSMELTTQHPYGGERMKPTTAILETDGRPETLEALRDEIGWRAEVLTVAQFRAQDDWYADEYGALRRGVRTLTLFLLLVNGLTLLVAMVDWVMERRRALAVLSAVGVPSGVLRRSILAQVALPLATSVVLGVAGALVVVALLYTAVETEVALPVRELAVLSAGTVLVVAIVTGLVTPWIRVARRPELLRTG